MKSRQLLYFAFMLCASAAAMPTFAQCPGEPCTPALQPGTWTTGVVGGNASNGANEDCHIDSVSGQFPGFIDATIRFSKEPASGNGCKFHSGGSTSINPWMRWAEITLSPCMNFGVQMEWNLATFDQWVPGNAGNSDVFFLAIGAQPFTNVSVLGAVSCDDSPKDSESYFQGKVFWWGNNTLNCSGSCNQSSFLSPCQMNGRRVFDYKLFIVNSAVSNLLNTNVLTAHVLAPTIPARAPAGGIPQPPNTPHVSGISMVSPVPGAVYSSGGQIPVIVTAINGFQPERILALSGYDVKEIDPVVLQANLEIPPDAVGPMSLYVLAYDANSNYAETEDVVVQVVPPAALTGISIEPESFQLDRLGPTQALKVTGQYADGIDRDLTAGVLGTTYELDDNCIVAVSVDGLVESAGFGETRITARNGTMSAVASVEVIGLPCPADIIENDAVDSDDLTAVILSWGPCYACGADIDGNGVVDISDISTVVLSWGPCPAP